MMQVQGDHGRKAAKVPPDVVKGSKLFAFLVKGSKKDDSEHPKEAPTELVPEAAPAGRLVVVSFVHRSLAPPLAALGQCRLEIMW